MPIAVKNSREIYLDNNATTRPTPEVVEAVVGILASGYGNPSSAHQRGVAAREFLETARRRVGSLVGASEERVVFTSGGTEANNLALNGLAGKNTGRLVTTETEHSSILKKARALEEAGTEIVYLPVDGSGRLNPDAMRDALEKPADLVSVHWVNNETGVEQPVGELGEICRGSGVIFHVDGAQAVGKMPIDFDSMPVDILTFSAHKLHGPQGVGAICFKNAADVTPVAFGGDQERFVRPGTENLPGIAGFGAAAENRERDFLEIRGHLENMRDTFERGLSDAFPDIRVNGAQSPRACNTSNILFSGIDGMALMALLDREGVICSQTSACNSRRPEPSHVLLAMGLSESEAFASVRFSFSALNTIEEAGTAGGRVADCYGKLLELEGAGI